MLRVIMLSLISVEMFVWRSSVLATQIDGIHLVDGVRGRCHCQALPSRRTKTRRRYPYPAARAQSLSRLEHPGWRSPVQSRRSRLKHIGGFALSGSEGSRAELDPVTALGHRPVTACHNVLHNTTTVLDDLGGAHVVVIAGHQHPRQTNRRRNSRGLAQDGRGVTAATEARTHPVFDVPPNLCKVGVERVPNRNPADDLPFSLSNKKRHRHPALR